MKWFKGLLKVAYVALIAVLPVAAIADYSATTGAGLTFGSFDLAGVKFPAFVGCDPATAKQCWSISAAGAVKVDGSAATQPVSGTVTANAGTNLNTSALATSANLTAGTAKTQIVDGSGNVIASTTNALNVQVANANANGQATAANSSPVVAPVLTVAGAAVVKGGVPVVNGASRYQAVAASATATVLQSSTGVTGDYLSHCTIYPATTSPGVVTVFDGSNTAANSAILFPGGASSVSNLVPFTIAVGAFSRNGSWQATTGTNVSIVCEGSFS